MNKIFKCPHCISAPVFTDPAKFFDHARNCVFSPEVRACASCGLNALRTITDKETSCRLGHATGKPVTACKLWQGV